ncbi:MAG: serine hydrolase [Anaerolineae bacterium]|nr:serine hydrolase [Anaerolineae bacterium]
MRRESRFSTILIRYLLVIALLLGAAALAYQAFLYLQQRRFLPVGMTMAGVNVAGLTPEDAAAAVAQPYSQPVVVYHFENMIQIDPADVGFVLDMEAMIAAAEHIRTQEEFWPGFVSHLLQRPLNPVQVDLIATHNPAQVEAMALSIANYLDQPMSPPQMEPTTLTFKDGADGYVTDVDAAAAAIEAALYSLTHRTVILTINAETAPEPGLDLLRTYMENKLSTFPGGGSFYILDLETGEEISLNADQAMSGMSMMKIPIILETYRAVDNQLSLDQTKLVSETIILSGNYSANLLLDVVAGMDNAYLGSDILTQSMRRLGLENTFIATPYEEPARPDRITYITTANSNMENRITLDPAMQTTAREMGELLAMIYYCAQGQGPLLAIYPEQLTQRECQEMLYFLSLNMEGYILRPGVPPCTTVAHKHGWINGDVGYHGTHGDAAIIQTPGRDYVLVTYVYVEGWLDWTISFPFMADISRAVYNYYNQDEPFLQDVLREGIANNKLEIMEADCGEPPTRATNQ